MTSDITTRTSTDAPYVAVGVDQATGRAVIGLDAAAVDVLTGILSDLVSSDAFTYPDSDPAGAARQGAVAHAILRPLLQLQGYLS